MARLLTFGLNIVIARNVDKNAYGIGFVNLEMFGSFGLYFMKNGFRRAAIRLLSEDISGQSSIILSWVAILFSFVFNIVLASIWIANPPDLGGSTIISYNVSVAIMCVANVIESLVEPYFVLEIKEQRLQTKPYVEGVCLGIRTIVLGGLCLAFQVPFVASYSLAYLAYACAWFIGYVAHRHLVIAAASSPEKTSEALVILPNSGMLRKLWTGRDWQCLWLRDRRHAALCRQLLFSAGQKMILGQGEKIILLGVFDEETWGVYALVSNLGSLVLRTLFAPVEGIAFSFFSSENGSGKNDDDEKTDNVSKTRRRLAIARVLLGIQGIIGFVAATFGPVNGYVAIRLLYGSAWADSEETIVAFRMYCVFLFFASLNGILEAYVHATADVRWMQTNVYFQGIASLILCALSWSLRRYQACGLIVASAVSMLLRVCRCVLFAQSAADWIQDEVLRIGVAVISCAVI
eukprot:g5087.t1